MSIPLYAQRSEIFKEFTEIEQKNYFSLTQKKYLSEIDNFYYNVYVDEENSEKGIKNLCEELNEKRESFDFKSQDKIDFFGLDYYPFGSTCYNNMLEFPECFNIFVCSNNLPNTKTPRIHIQIRSRMIWLYGCRSCIDKSYKFLELILNAYNINVKKVVENRIDYAHHNNAIQSPEKFFDRSNLHKHCKTNARIYNLVGNPQNNWDLSYCSIGSRSSKSVFFRIYHKSREVVEQNYKVFFIDLWYKNKLISAYDKFCLEYAFKLKSYDVGILCGQLHWYMQYGKDEHRKKVFEDLYKKYFAENINTAMLRNNTRKYIEKHISYDIINYVRRKILYILPPVTVITNIEFETHRDFYRSFDKSLLKIINKSKNILARVHQVYGCRKAFVVYLTSYGNNVSFVSDNKVKLKDFTDDMYLSFWKRLRSSKWNTDYKPDLFRSYERTMDLERAKRKIISDAAVLSIHKNGLNMNDTTSDFADVFSLINDNDIQGMFFVDDNGEYKRGEIKYADSDILKMRKNRQYRSILSSSVDVYSCQGGTATQSYLDKTHMI